MPNRYYSNTAPPQALTVQATTTSTTLTVSSTTGYPDTPFILGLERGTANEEVVLCTGKTATTFTVTRGYDGTSGKGHDIGTSVEHTVAALDYTEAALALDRATQAVSAAGSAQSEVDAVEALVATAQGSANALRDLGNAKGDLFGYSADNTPARVPVGSNRHSLLGDSAQGTGVRWGTNLLLGAYSETCPFITVGGAGQALDLATSSSFRLLLNTSTTLSFSNLPVSGEVFSLTLVVVQDATGGRTLTFPSTVRWSYGAVPAPPTGPNKVNIYSLVTVDGGSNWYGFMAGEDMR